MLRNSIFLTVFLYSLIMTVTETKDSSYYLKSSRGWIGTMQVATKRVTVERIRNTLVM